MMHNLILATLVFSAFYKHGTPQNLWYRVGKWSNKFI